MSKLINLIEFEYEKDIFINNRQLLSSSSSSDEPLLLCTNTNYINKIEKIECSQLKYNDFFWNYMFKNIPIVIRSVSNNWLCRSKWIKNSKINFEYLRNQINNMLVPVANCSQEHFNSHKKFEMKFHEYLEYWEHNKNNQTIDTSSETTVIATTEIDNYKDILYLKDWHLKDKMPNYEFYEVPIYFTSDWLNEFLIDNNEDDYRFVYMGPKGSWTPFHSDVFSSFSWSTNIIGIKRWLILPPNEELKLKDNLGNDPFSIDEEYLIRNHVKYYKIDQYENESIFIPSGWYHQVWNLTDTISINHNWFNGCNILLIWNNLVNYMNKVRKEINDCRTMENFDNHSEIMLKALYGMNYEQFLNIIEYIVKKRIDSIKKNIDLISFKTYRLNQCHIIFDIKSIKNVLDMIKQNDVIQNNIEFISKCNHLLEILRNFNEESF